jgi:RNA polymerase sigma-70 factor, ECF subfamily
VGLVSFQKFNDKDGQLMLAYAKGDSSAFERLYRKHKDALYRFFLRQSGNQALAEELYQEVWLRVIKARDSYEQKAKFTTWLYRIAHNILIDHYRKPQTEKDDEFEAESIPDNAANDPEVILSGQEKIQRFRTQLENLPKEQLEVFLLKEEAGLSLEEIALTVGESKETVKSRLRYAIKKLRQLLKNENLTENVIGEV